MFRNLAINDDAALAIQALKSLLKNPAGLPFYRHYSKASDNITAASLLPLKIGKALYDLRLRIEKKLPFYEITATLALDGRQYPLEEATLQYDDFIVLDQVFHLAGNRSEEHTSELHSLMRISYAFFC